MLVGERDEMRPGNNKVKVYQTRFLFLLLLFFRAAAIGCFSGALFEFVTELLSGGIWFRWCVIFFFSSASNSELWFTLTKGESCDFIESLSHRCY